MYQRLSKAAVGVVKPVKLPAEVHEPAGVTGSVGAASCSVPWDNTKERDTHNTHRVTEVCVEAIGQLCYPGGDLVKVHRFPSTVPLYNKHLCDTKGLQVQRQDLS